MKKMFNPFVLVPQTQCLHLKTVPRFPAVTLTVILAALHVTSQKKPRKTEFSCFFFLCPCSTVCVSVPFESGVRAEFWAYAYALCPRLDRTLCSRRQKQGHNLTVISAQTARFITKHTKQVFTARVPCCQAWKADSTYSGGILHRDLFVQENFDRGLFCMQSRICCGKFRTHML